MRSLFSRHLYSVISMIVHLLLSISETVLSAVDRCTSKITMQKAEAEMSVISAARSANNGAKPSIGAGSGDSPLRFSWLLKAINGHTYGSAFA